MSTTSRALDALMVTNGNSVDRHSLDSLSVDAHISCCRLVSVASERLPKCSDWDDLDLISNSLFRKYVWWLLESGRLAIYLAEMPVGEAAGSDMPFYVRPSELRDVAFRISNVVGFASDEKLDVTRVLNEWHIHLLLLQNGGSYADYTAFMKDWGSSRVSSWSRSDRLFLQVVFNYFYERASDTDAFIRCNS